MKHFSWLWLILITAVIVVYGSLNPEVHLFPKCPFLSLTGLKCPGCGSQRAIHQLLHGHIGEVFRLNALFIPAMFYACSGYFSAFFFTERWPVIRQKWFGRHAAFVTLAAIMVYWIGRNLN